jgi:aspartokinase
METFAVYWEPVIKTYGIFERTGLCLVSFQLKPEWIGEMGNCLLSRADSGEGDTILFFARPTRDGMLVIHVLLASESAVSEMLETGSGSSEIMTDVRIDKDVELVYFQGPHFGDRYGIAEAALKALASHDVALTAAISTGASVYLITSKGGSPLIKNALAGVFSAP